MSKSNIIFILIILLAFILRFWNLGHVPISPDWDEAAWGYNAYSILHTGRDEYGKLFPLVLQSFNVFPPAMYTYLSIPAIAFLGLTSFAVRTPSAFFGVISVILTYFVVKELFKRVDLALISSFLLAVSPWAIQFSRFAHEGNIAIVFNLLTILFFLKGLKKPYYLIFCAIASGLSIYTYNSEKIFAPLLMLALILIYREDLLKIAKKYLFLFIATGILVILPMALTIIVNPASLNRASSTNFTNDTHFFEKSPTRILLDKENNDYIGLILDNRRLVYVRQIAGGYLSHFDPNWLFIKGDQPRHHAPGMGLLYLWELPFLLIGIYFIIFNKNFEKKSKILLFVWFLIAAIPASITQDVPHAGRTLNSLPTWQIFTAAGLLAAYLFLNEKVKRKFVRYFIFLTFIVIASFNFIYFLNQYFVQQNYFNSKDWQYGWKEAINYVDSVSGKYDRIVITDKTPLDQSYIFFLFNLKYSPKKYLSQQHDINNHNFEKFEFRNIDWGVDHNMKNTLFVGRPSDFNDGQVLKTIKYMDGEDAIKIVVPQ
jgi:4-amino-4-deoxy-L-arabinose transferase-like glycosyltransferase